MLQLYPRNTMTKVKITGPNKLSGTVHIQGAKNSSNRHLLAPLLTNDKFTFHNIPRITTSESTLELIKSQGAKYKWTAQNSTFIDCSKITSSKPISSDLFYHTSGGIIAIPIIASRFGQFKVEKTDRKDYGGCKIGSRNLGQVRKTLKNLGIEYSEKENYHAFKLKSNSAFNLKVPVKSYSVSVMATLAALFKNGPSTISNLTREPEFYDFLSLLRKMKAKFKIDNDKLVIYPSENLTGTDFTNMSDRHDFVTWLNIALITNSKLKLEGIDYKKMGLEALYPELEQMNVKLRFSDNSCLVPAQLEKLKPVNMKATKYPHFQTEWQPLFSPLLTQIKGKSIVVEALFAKRMVHWKQLKNMGIKVELKKSETKPNYLTPNEDYLNEAIVGGPQTIKGAKVDGSNDVRTAATLLIAGLAAKGETILSGFEKVERGYENIIMRLKELGAKIKKLE